LFARINRVVLAVAVEMQCSTTVFFEEKKNLERMQKHKLQRLHYADTAAEKQCLHSGVTESKRNYFRTN
jgi:hypothetical protein